MYKPIEDYGIIGNMHSAALVSKDGSIDYCSMPHIDSPTVFAALLDDEKGGSFSIQPKEKFEAKQEYIENTNILKTTFTSPSGIAELIDFMPIPRDEEESHEILRIIKGIEGKIEFKIIFDPRPNYTKSPSQKTEQTFSIAKNQQITFSFKLGGKLKKDTNPSSFDKTKEFWENWLHNCEAGKCKTFGKYEKLINRSLLTLKLLTFEPTGAIAAAATTSLPETIGGERNWDYRYTWLRDSSFTLKALFAVGHILETERYINWLHEIYKNYGSSGLQIMYSLEGNSKLEEKELPHLNGYKGSKPVRIGNGAYNQKQLDIYGEIMDSALRLSDYAGEIDEELWPFFRDICNLAQKEWQTKDSGIWEVRSGPNHFVYSKVMCWVALDRGIKIARRYGFDAEIELWQETAQKIKDEVISKGFNKKLNNFTQHYETEALDSSNLIIPLMAFLPINDPKVQETIEATQKNLMKDGFLLRYNTEKTDDGLSGEEGAFVFCNFWLVECLVLQNKLDQAEKLLENTQKAANHLGLFSEEYDYKNKTQLGNFPQAFTHIGFINAVNALLNAKARKNRKKISFAKNIQKLLPFKVNLNPSPDRAKQTSQNIAEDLKKTLNHLQGAFFDVDASQVDYDAMRSSEAYKKYVGQAKLLRGFDLSSLKTNEEKKAFWINIYNILVIHGVIELNIEKSVKEAFVFFKRINYNIGGKNFTPDDIEHGILRKMGDPRIHFALVCASSSCPPIEFYDAEKIDQQLNTAAHSFLNRNGAKLLLSPLTLHLSPIFKWFQPDFGKNEKEVVKFLLPYFKEDSQKFIKDNLDKLKIEYLPYDWNLNRSLKR